MKKEYLFLFIGGLFLLAYILEAIVNPLPNSSFATPYDFLNPNVLNRYPFTTAIIAIKSLAIFLSPLLLLSYLPNHHFAKGIGLLILSGLTQLYAIQDIASSTQVLPLEWSISINLAALALLLPAILQLLLGLAKKTKQKLLSPKTTPTPSETASEQ